jgi:hypothetical protein
MGNLKTAHKKTGDKLEAEMLGMGMADLCIRLGEEIALARISGKQ